MKRKFKLLTLSTVSATCLSIGLISTTTSCQDNNQNEPDTSQIETNVNSQSVSKSLAENYLLALKHNISCQTKSRSATDCITGNISGIDSLGTTTVYVDFYENVDSVLGMESTEEYISQINTISELLELTHTAGVEISLTTDGNHDATVTFSDAEAIEALNPMIPDCKTYLRGIGLTESDLQDMLTESGADETMFIPFVWACMQHEANALSISSNKPLDDIFLDDKCQISWKKAGDCAMEALGLDIFYGLSQSTLKTWEIKLIKKAFITVAKKMVGPIGTLIFVGDFAWCLYRDDLCINSDTGTNSGSTTSGQEVSSEFGSSTSIIP